MSIYICRANTVSIILLAIIRIAIYRIVGSFRGVKFSWMRLQLYYRSYSRVEILWNVPTGDIRGLALFHLFVGLFFTKGSQPRKPRIIIRQKKILAILWYTICVHTFAGLVCFACLSKQ